MRNIDADWQALLAADDIHTYWGARLDFLSGSVFVWTGMGSIQPTGSGDPLLDGNVFDSLGNGVVASVGDNSFSYSGSDQLDLVLNVPADVSGELVAAAALPAEWQTRPATVWRALLKRPADPLAQPIWLWRRIRTGSLDGFLMSADGTSITFKLTVESHQAMISNATGSLYLDQPLFDATDHSQDFVLTLANGGTLSSVSGGSGGTITANTQAYGAGRQPL